MWTPDPAIIVTAAQQAASASAFALTALRNERDRLLASSDWVILRSMETGVPPPVEWLEYRQALRDLPAQTHDASDVSWPIEPGGLVQ